MSVCHYQSIKYHTASVTKSARVINHDIFQLYPPDKYSLSWYTNSQECDHVLQNNMQSKSQN
jgi:hypothetical protein